MQSMHHPHPDIKLGKKQLITMFKKIERQVKHILFRI